MSEESLYTESQMVRLGEAMEVVWRGLQAAESSKFYYDHGVNLDEARERIEEYFEELTQTFFIETGKFIYFEQGELVVDGYEWYIPVVIHALGLSNFSLTIKIGIENQSTKAELIGIDTAEYTLEHLAADFYQQMLTLAAKYDDEYEFAEDFDLEENEDRIPV